MATRTSSEVYADLIAAGFSPAQATTMTAIAVAESSNNDAALGDVSLEDGTWGPSYGLFQVRTLKADTGKGTDRDINWLSQSDANQAKAAYDISGHGSNFSPWTTFTSGAYQKYLGQAQSAAAAAGVTPVADSGSGGGMFGPAWLPWNWGAAANSTASSFYASVLTALGALLGAGLVGTGVVVAVRPKGRA